MINVGIADDHAIVRNGIKRILESHPDISVIVEGSNGEEFINRIHPEALPNIAIIDMNMPVMNGFKTVEVLQRSYPSIRPIVFSLLSGKDVVMNMINCGVCGYLGKNSDPSKLIDAVIDVHEKGVYFSELMHRRIFNYKKTVSRKAGFKGIHNFTFKETEFISLCATELSYEEIGKRMRLSTKTVENYRDHIFRKLEINNRNALTLFAIRNGLADAFTD